MILFCDTSALVKLSIVEPQSDQMSALVAEAERPVAFACADQRLARAAKILGLAVPLS